MKLAKSPAPTPVRVAMAPTLIWVEVTPVVVLAVVDDGDGPVVVVPVPVVGVVAAGEFEHAATVIAARSETHPTEARRRTAVPVMVIPPCVV